MWQIFSWLWSRKLSTSLRSFLPFLFFCKWDFFFPPLESNKRPVEGFIYSGSASCLTVRSVQSNVVTLFLPWWYHLSTSGSRCIPSAASSKSSGGSIDGGPQGGPEVLLWPPGLCVSDAEAPHCSCASVQKRKLVPSVGSFSCCMPSSPNRRCEQHHQLVKSKFLRVLHMQLQASHCDVKRDGVIH